MTLSRNDRGLRETFLDAVRKGVEAPRNDATKWNQLYYWFEDALLLPGGTRAGVIGKVIVESKQIGNRIDEMVRHQPRYAVISVLGDVTPEKVLRAMQRRALPELECILFFEETRPVKLVVFDD